MTKIEEDVTPLRRYLARERLFSGTFLFVVSLLLSRSTRQGWLQVCGGICRVTYSPMPPHPAPEAYRVAIPAIAGVLSKLFLLKDATLAFALIDFVCSFLALGVLCYLAVEGIRFASETLIARITTLVIFFAFIQFPISFIFFRQRLETLPTSLFIAVALLCLSKARNSSLWVVLLFLATAAQALVRADVPFIFGIALLILSLCGNVLAQFGSKYKNLLCGAGVTLISGGIQAYMQFIRFPHLPYATGSPVVIMLNFKWVHLIVFTIALLPFALLIYPIMERRRRLSSLEVVVITTAALYLPVWFTVGIVSEVRIFVPFLLALCVVASRVSATYLLQDKFVLDSRSS